MATIQLYTQPDEGALQTYTMGTFTMTDLEAGTDYQEVRKTQLLVSSLDRSVWALKLNLASGAMDNLEVDRNNQPFPIINLQEIHDPSNILKASNCDLTATHLADRPDDWDVHWRDKYTLHYTQAVGSGSNAYTMYRQQPNVAPTQGTVASDLPFTASVYYDTNQSRWLYWTTGGCYFALENKWDVYTTPLGAKRIQQAVTAFYIGPYNKGTTNYRDNYRYVNSIRERGISGPYLFQDTDDINAFQINKFYNYDTVSGQSPRVYLNFIQFEYPFTLQSGEIVTEDMVGVCVWEEGLDGTPLSAQIMALSKTFWEPKDKPAYTGPTSNVQGGGGRFSRNSQKGGLDISTVTSNWNAAVTAVTSSYNKFVADDTSSLDAVSMFISKIVDPRSWNNVFDNVMASPLNATIAFHLMPSRLAPASNGTSSHISAGGVDFTETSSSGGKNCNKFTDDYYHYSFGSVSLPEDTGSFADYTNTSVMINLPYIGVFEIDVSACMGGSIAVDYVAEAFSGDCVAFVTVMDRDGTEWTRYSWKGNCSKTIPLATYTPPGARIAGAIAKTAVAAGIGALTGGLGAYVAASSLASNRVTAALDNGGWISQNRPELIPQLAQRQASIEGAQAFGQKATIDGIAGIKAIGNNIGSALNGGATVSSNASGGYVSTPVDTRIWVLVIKPVWSNPEYYSRQCAYPSDIEGRVSEFKGLLSVSSIEADGIECTDVERSEIVSLMKAGVYLDDTVE